MGRGTQGTSEYQPVLFLYPGGEFISIYVIVVAIKTERMCSIHCLLDI